jgi:hypothetical protein
MAAKPISNVGVVFGAMTIGEPGLYFNLLGRKYADDLSRPRRHSRYHS